MAEEGENLVQNSGKQLGSPDSPSPDKAIAGKLDEVVENIQTLSKGSDQTKKNTEQIDNIKKSQALLEEKTVNTFKLASDAFKYLQERINAINAKLKTSNEEEQPASPEEPKEDKPKKSSISEKLKNVVTHFKPKKKSTFKTNSKIDEKKSDANKPVNVTIKSFSAAANKQMIENLKKALEIKKQEDGLLTKANLMKLAILAFIGMLVFVIFKIKEIHTAFTKWWDETKAKILDIKNGVMSFFSEIYNQVKTNLIDPIITFLTNLKNTWDKAVTATTNTFKEVWEGIKSIADGFIDTFRQIKNMSAADILKIIDDSINSLKKKLNEWTGINLFKIEEPKEAPEQDATSGSKANDSVPSSAPAASGQQPSKQDDVPSSKQQAQNVNNTVNNINNSMANNAAGDNVKIGGNTNATTLQLQNGNTIKLDKQDDIYIANKPDGVIHNIFKSMIENYDNAKGIFKTNFDAVVTSMNKQDEYFKAIANNLGKGGNNSASPQMINDILKIVDAKIVNIQPPKPPTTYTGVDRLRKQYRAIHG